MNLTHKQECDILPRCLSGVAVVVWPYGVASNFNAKAAAERAAILLVAESGGQVVSAEVEIATA